MNEVDVIIVGCGLGGIAFTENLRAHNKSFIVFDDDSQYSSLVAAGLYNPVVLKRFTPVWEIKAQLKLALPFYEKLEKELGVKIDHKLRILRRFASIEEQNQWFAAADRPVLEDYLSLNIIKNGNEYVDAPYGCGEVLGAGRVDTFTMIDAYRSFLRQIGCLVQARFNYSNLTVENDGLIYQSVKAKHIVFSEGFGVKQNPFFNSMPLNGTKGEVLTVHAPQLQIDYAVKSSVFIIPLGDDLYRVGSTYNRNDKSNEPTETGKNELLSKLKSFIKADIKVVNHVAGIRPTVKDRRPLVGSHAEYPNLYLLNGLGSRGVLIAPFVANELYNSIFHHQPINDEINMARFI